MKPHFHPKVMHEHGRKKHSHVVQLMWLSTFEVLNLAIDGILITNWHNWHYCQIPMKPYETSSRTMWPSDHVTMIFQNKHHRVNLRYIGSNPKNQVVLPTFAGKTFRPDTGLSQESPIFFTKKNRAFLRSNHPNHPTQTPHHSAKATAACFVTL